MSTESWVSAELSDLVFLQRGFDITKAEQKPGAIPVISSSGISSYHNEAKVNGPGVVIGRKGTLGTVHYSESAYWPHDTTLWSKDFKGNNARYVYYFLKTLRLEHFNVGNANPTLNRNHIHKLKIKIPDIETQKSIVDVLICYDELIANNNRRIQLLEELARLLYREWFVHLRFPGHEKVKIKDGVPDGWDKSALKELCDRLDYGFTASATSEEIGPKFLRITDIVPAILEWNNVPYCECPESKKHNYLLKEGDVVIARTGATTGYAKRIGKSHPEAVFASYLVRMRFSKRISNYIAGIFLESDSYKSFVRSNWGGAAQPGANAQTLSRVEILVPDNYTQQKFDDVVKPIFMFKENLIDQNSRLRASRDLLLPRLMNGDIEL